jgi:hypothetical protein
MGAQMTAPGQAVAATSTDDVAFSADELSDRNIRYVGSSGDNFADELMADRETLFDGGTGPGVPVINV